MPAAALPILPRSVSPLEPALPIPVALTRIVDCVRFGKAGCSVATGLAVSPKPKPANVDVSGASRSHVVRGMELAVDPLLFFRFNQAGLELLDIDCVNKVTTASSGTCDCPAGALSFSKLPKLISPRAVKFSTDGESTLRDAEQDRNVIFR